MATELDPEAEYASFITRIEANKTRTRVRNESLPVGSLMHYDCMACQADMMRDELDFSPREEYCGPCRALKKADILDAFIARATSIAV